MSKDKEMGAKERVLAVHRKANTVECMQLVYAVRVGETPLSKFFPTEVEAWEDAASRLSAESKEQPSTGDELCVDPETLASCLAHSGFKKHAAELREGEVKCGNCNYPRRVHSTFSGEIWCPMQPTQFLPSAPSSESEKKLCEKCEGNGKVLAMCGECNGTGYEIRPASPVNSEGPDVQSQRSVVGEKWPAPCGDVLSKNIHCTILKGHDGDHYFMDERTGFKTAWPVSTPAPVPVSAEQDLANALGDALEDLVAQVRGECPSLLDEDSGGDAQLSIRIDDALQAWRQANG